MKYAFSVHLLTAFLKIFTLDFSPFWAWLRIYNLQKLMHLKFRGQFMLRLKGAKTMFFKFFEQFCHDYFWNKF